MYKRLDMISSEDVLGIRSSEHVKTTLKIHFFMHKRLDMISGEDVFSYKVLKMC